MDKEKFERYKNATGIALLNAFKNGELTKDEYRLILKLKQSGVETIQGQDAQPAVEEDTKPKPEPSSSVASVAIESHTTKEEAPPTPRQVKVKVEPKESAQQPTGLILKDGQDGPRTNYTKFPNAIFDKLASNLEPAEEILYYKLWRLSWGYKRNYCRVGYHELLTTTSIKSRFKVVDGINGLVSKGYIARILGPDGKADMNQSGTLYRVFTADEIIKGITEEGILISSIPDSSIPERSILESGIPTEDIPNAPGVSQSSIPEGSIPTTSIPESSIPSEKSYPDSNSGSILDTGIPEPDTHINKDILKDTLSLKDIFKDKGIDLVTYFYNQIRQPRISKKERERAREAYNSLKKDGFTEEEISFAAEWTIQNVKDARSFAILERTIGQALAEREKIIERQALEEEMEKERQAELEKSRREEEESAKLDEYISNLSSAEKEALEYQARDELIRKEQLKERFINPMVLNAKVKEIIKREYDWK